MPYRSFLELALAGDRRGIRSFVRRLEQAGYGPDRIGLEIVGPALVEVGDRWMRNALSVADEHLVSAIAEQVLTEIALGLPDPPGDAPVIVLGSAGNEAHRIGQRIVEGLFVRAGWRVHALGTGVPSGDLAAMASKLRARAIGLSVTMSYHVEEAREALRHLRASPGLSGVMLLVGGAIFRAVPELAVGLDADWVGADAPEAVRYACTLASGRPSIEAR